ncbi:MAG: DNA repair protein RadC [Flavobacteriaceae bacterium]
MPDKPTSFSIKRWADDDRPREKLMRNNRSVLSDAELIAILIGSGTPKESAVALSKRILASVGNNLNELGKCSVQQLMKFKGIGEAKAVSIVAALEIGRRRREEGPRRLKKIRDAKDVQSLMQPLIADLPHEEFWIIYLNNSNGILRHSQLSKGGITGTLVDIRLIMKEALELGAIGLILVHNHPSGILKPSLADINLTEKIKLAAEELEIKLLDHLIIAAHHYFSFADKKML